MKPYEYILKLSVLKKVNEKKALLRAAAVDGCTQLFQGFQLALDKKRIFNVKSSPLIEIDKTFSKSELNKQGTYTWEMFLSLIDLLEKDELDEETKKNLLYEAAEESGILEWNAFYRPIIMKDMKCGVNAKTINTVLDEFGTSAAKYKVPIWKIKKLTENGFMNGKKFIEPLLSGSRVLTIINRHNKTIKMYSETGRLIKKPKIDLSTLYAIIEELPESIILDGNICNRSYQSLMNGTIDDNYYAIYDILLLRDFDQNYCPLDLKTRKETLVGLETILAQATDRKVYILPSLLIDFDSENADQRFSFYTEELKDAGFDYIVVKDAASAYNCDKDILWFKKKII